ncbi:AAA family ATPase [Desulfofalx alkaliphila]|uniref:AAA family ATPase n=1 Tax=Desulfofalx alkaliphila TaxID=105483 RepID=UPI0004E129AB|nr:AAA family ATPase [Desulfofalx alkaliphila]
MLSKLKPFSKKQETPQELILWSSLENDDDTQNEDIQEEKYTELYGIPISPEAIEGEGMIWTVQSPEGGNGATAVATNLAALLARGNPEKVVIVDLDGIGAVRSRMGLPIEQCVVNILDWEDVRGTKDMQRAMVAHSSGVMVVPGVVHYDHVSLVTPSLIFNILRILKGRFEHIVLDCSPVGMQSLTWAAALVSDAVLTILTPNRSCLDLAKDNISFLNRLGCKDRTIVILNQTGIPGGIRASDLLNNSKLGVEIHHILPYSIRVAEHNNKRELVSIVRPKDDFSVALSQLLKLLTMLERG